MEDAPYYGIEAVWSAANLWVNMQQDKPPAAMAYDLQVRVLRGRVLACSLVASTTTNYSLVATCWLLLLTD